MHLEPKEMTCECGHTFTIDRQSDWCAKCCTRVFYNEKDKRAHKISSYYMYTLMILVAFFLTYTFVELVVVNLP